jgi:hypothetical protein
VQWHLYRIALDGSATLLGSYAAFSSNSLLNPALDGQGRLYLGGEDPTDAAEDAIFRLTADGATPELVYTELSEPYVKIHIAWLVTGG